MMGTRIQNYPEEFYMLQIECCETARGTFYKLQMKRTQTNKNVNIPKVRNTGNVFIEASLVLLSIYRSISMISICDI